MSFVTIEEARAHLRIDTAADDPWLETFIPAVSGAVALWLKDSWRLYVPALDSSGEPIRTSSGATIPYEDSAGNFIVHPTVRAATLVELAQQYRYRDGTDATAVPSHEGWGYVLGRGATALLVALRRSTSV